MHANYGRLKLAANLHHTPASEVAPALSRFLWLFGRAVHEEAKLKSLTPSGRISVRRDVPQELLYVAKAPQRTGVSGNVDCPVKRYTRSVGRRQRSVSSALDKLPISTGWASEKSCRERELARGRQNYVGLEAARGRHSGKF